jgi:hypothetical protein
LRAQALLATGGAAGLLATNTIAQGDTREVGLDQMIVTKAAIYRAIPSRKWPGEASLEVAHIWFYNGPWRGLYILEDMPVAGINSLLQVPGRVIGKPYKLAANEEKSFQGSIALGMGFVLEPEAAQRLIEKNPRNQEVLQLYLNGEDLNTRWDQSPSRWVINFRDWPLEKAKEYPDCFDIVERLVKPERDKLADGDATARDRARRWWQFARPTRALYEAISGLSRVLLCTRVSKYLNFAFVPNCGTFTLDVFVFAFEDTANFAPLQSSAHLIWVQGFPSTHETRMRYAASDVFETFPFPNSIASLGSIGERYFGHRREVMCTRREGLTSTYNRFHTAHEVSQDIAKLRELHVEMDYAVASTYGWSDLELDHGFYETKQGMRYAISEKVRREVLDRLLALNHERHAQEEGVASAEPKPKRKKAKRNVTHPELF